MRNPRTSDSHTEDQGREVYASIAALYLAYFFSFFHRTVTGILSDEMREIAERSGWDPALLSVTVSSAYFYTYAAMQIPAGILADALGARRYAALSTSLMALGSLLSSIASPLPLIVGRLLVGLGAAAIWISMQRVIGVKVGKARGGLLTGLGLMVGGLGNIAATLPARLLLVRFGLSGLFLSTGLASLLASVAILLAVNDEGLGLDSVKAGLSATLKQLGSVVQTPHSLALAVAGLATYSAYLAFMSYWAPLYLEEYTPVTGDAVASLLLLASISFTATVPLVGYVSDARGRRKPILVASCILHGAAWASAVVLANGPPERLIPYMVLLGIIAATHSIISPMARELYRPEFSGTTLSFVNGVTFAGVAVYQAAGYVIRDPLQALMMFSAIAAVATVLTHFVRETMD
ncbi:MAG: MFS transporter [Thermofilaceae archaeon]